MSTPVVSVVMGVYNGADHLEQTLASILSQEGCDLEFIVVDDNSPDGTLQTVKAEYGNDPRVKTILRTSDRGLAKSLHAGIDQASGDHILMMDTDFTHPPEEVPLACGSSPRRRTPRSP